MLAGEIFSTCLPSFSRRGRSEEASEEAQLMGSSLASSLTFSTRYLGLWLTECLTDCELSQPGTGSRLIPNGTIQGAHFVKTPDYVQITGSFSSSESEEKF